MGQVPPCSSSLDPAWCREMSGYAILTTGIAPRRGASTALLAPCLRGGLVTAFNMPSGHELTSNDANPHRDRCLLGCSITSGTTTWPGTPHFRTADEHLRG